MRWIAVLLLSFLGIAELMAAEANKPSCSSVQITPTGAIQQQPPLPRPVPAATGSDKNSDANRSAHLRKAAEHLRAAGLNSLAEHICGLLYEPSVAKSPEEPGLTKAQTQVLFHIKILELEKEKVRKLGFDFSKTQLFGGKGQPVQVGIFDALREDGLVQALRKDGLARVIAEPTLVTVIGRPAHFHSGGEVMLWAPGPDGKPVQYPKRYGTCVDLYPQLNDKGRLRLDMRLEHSEVDEENGTIVAGKKNPGIRERSVDTALEMNWGQTVVLSGLEQESHAFADEKTGPASVATVSTVILVTAEAIEPLATRQPMPARTTLRKQ